MDNRRTVAYYTTSSIVMDPKRWQKRTWKTLQEIRSDALTEDLQNIKMMWT